MPMNCMTLIQAHGGGQSTFSHTFPYWKRFGDWPIVVTTPSDDPLNCGGSTVILGRAGHSGPLAGQRIKLHFKYLLSVHADFFFLSEYDCCLLTPGIPIEIQKNPTGLWAPVAGGEKHPFLAPWFVHPPWCFDRDTLVKMSTKLFEIPDNAEQGFIDRQISLAAYRSGVEVHDMMNKLGLAYSTNTIEQRHFLDALTFVSRGAKFVHGIKL